MYGVDNPSTSRKVIIAAILVTSVVWLFGFWSDFIPSHEVVTVAGIVSIVLGLTLTAFLYWHWWHHGIKFKDKKSGLISKITLVIVAPFLCVMFFWGFVAQGSSAIITRVVGEPYFIDTELKKRKSSGYRTCKYTLQGEALAYAFPDYLCINEEFYKTRQDFVSVKLMGYKTILGFYIAGAYEMGNK